MGLHFARRKKIVQEHLKRGLLLKLILDKMSWKGIRIEPYLVMAEAWSAVCREQFGPDNHGFETGFLDESEMALVSARGWHDEAFYVRKLRQGHRCFGIKKNGRLAGFTWVDFEEFSSDAERFKLTPGEAYLYDIWTFEEFRGQGAAPLLRFRFYEALREMGISRMYSTTHYFNTPSVKFKAKIGARKVKLGLLIQLYGKHSWLFNVRRYAHERE